MRSWIHVFASFLVIDTAIYAKRIERHGNEPHGCDDGKYGIEIDLHGEADWKCMEDKWSNNESYTIDKMCYDEEPARHVCIDNTIDNLYKSKIPHSGPHRMVWAQYGEYNYLPPGRYVHNLEHGGVVFMYHPCASANMVAKLRQTATSCLYRYIVTAFPKLTKEYPFAVLTYGCIFRMSRVNPNEIKQWIRQRFGKSPESDVFGNGRYDHGLLVPSIDTGSYDYNDETKPFCPDVPLIKMDKEKSSMEVSQPERTTPWPSLEEVDEEVLFSKVSQPERNTPWPSLEEVDEEFSYESVGRESNNVFVTYANERQHSDTAWMNGNESVDNKQPHWPSSNMPDMNEQSVWPGSPHHDGEADSEKNQLEGDGHLSSNVPRMNEQSRWPVSPHHDGPPDSEPKKDGHLSSSMRPNSLWHHDEDGTLENGEPYSFIENNGGEETVSNEENFHAFGEDDVSNLDGADNIDLDDSQDHNLASDSMPTNVDNARGSKAVTRPGKTQDSTVSFEREGSLFFWVIASLCCFIVGLLLGICVMNCKARSEGTLKKYKVWSDKNSADSFSIAAVVRKIPNTFSNRNSNDDYHRLETNEQSSDNDNAV